MIKKLGYAFFGAIVGMVIGFSQTTWPDVVLFSTVFFAIVGITLGLTIELIRKVI
jgi:hypothetical protein